MTKSNNTLILAAGLILAFASAAPSETPASKPARKIGRITQAEAIRLCIAGLSDPNEHTRRNSASSLATFGPAAKPAVSELIRCLSNKTDAELRMYAARALGAIGPDAREAIPALRRALSEKSDFASNSVRKESAKALGLIDPKAAAAAIGDLVKLLGDDDLYVRRAATKSLSRMGPGAVAPLIKSLEHKNPEVRRRAGEALAQMQETAREALEKALESDKVLLRRSAAGALASPRARPQIKTLPKLAKRLRDKDKIVRTHAAEALVWSIYFSDAAIPALLGELKNDNELSFEIVALLSRMASSSIVLKKLLKAMDNTQSQMVRRQLIRTLGMVGVGGKEAAPAIRKLLNDDKLGPHAAVALFRIAHKDAGLKRLIDAYYAKHKLDGPYPGYAEDRRLLTRRMALEGPARNYAAAEAIRAAGRLFRNVNFVGKTKKEVLAVVGGCQASNPLGKLVKPDSDNQWTYRFDSGWGGWVYALTFKDGKVVSLKPGGLN